MICPTCRGNGKTAGGQVDPDDFSEDEWGAYSEGEYDQPCSACGGTGKLREDDEPIIRFGSDGQPVAYADEDDASEHLLRMAEGWA